MKHRPTITFLALAFCFNTAPATLATAALDADGPDNAELRKPPQAVVEPVEAGGTPAVPGSASAGFSEIPADVSTPNETTDGIDVSPSRETAGASDVSSPATRKGDPTYSIRLPLGVAGSVLPKIQTAAPAPPSSHTYMPQVADSNGEFPEPLAWRATAEAIRTQPATKTLLIGNTTNDFKTTYNNLLEEVKLTGWSLKSVSIPAGHFLIGIPGTGEPSVRGNPQDNASAWLIVVVSPLDQSKTEIRIKIQSRHASAFIPPVSNLLQRIQMRGKSDQVL